MATFFSMQDPYFDAQRRIAWFSRRDENEEIGDLGRSLILDHGVRTARATLLLHGLSAGPRQFLAVARELHARGHNVFVPRLPRHGRSDRLSDALATMSSAQLRACASDSLAVACGLGESVTVAGFSLGGLLGAYLAQGQPVRRLVAISPFLHVGFLPGLLRLPLARFLLRRPNRFYWWDPIRREQQLPEHGYPRFASHAVAQALTLAGDVMETSAKEPPAADELILVVNPNDSSVNNRAIAKLARQWASRKPGAVRVERLRDTPRFVHDIVEPLRYAAAAKAVLPKLVDLIDSPLP